MKRVIKVNKVTLIVDTFRSDKSIDSTLQGLAHTINAVDYGDQWVSFNDKLEKATTELMHELEAKL